MNMEVPHHQDPKDREVYVSMSRFATRKNRHLDEPDSLEFERNSLDDQTERLSFELGEIDRNLRVLETMKKIGLGERDILEVQAEELPGLIGLALLAGKRSEVAEGLARWAVFFSLHLTTLEDLVGDIKQSASDNDPAVRSALEMSRSMLSAANAIVPED
ncbi:hypothetical protein [Rathayibacter sp. AY1A7]|uniref:hypothetical protein n=1 Tax=Rathayibacter sp. AY1A7 TaxID=2080524 RepID=UPI0011B0DA57|nr:hypothetical protein [Rathayibacter sp. AY1A7]